MIGGRKKHSPSLNSGNRAIPPNVVHNTKTMKNIIPVLILISLPFQVMGQGQLLNKCINRGALIPQIKRYESDLYPKLLDHFNEYPLVRYVVLPAFDPEYAFQIEELDSNSLIIKANYFLTSFWDSHRRDTVFPIHASKQVDFKTGILLSELIQKELYDVDQRHYTGGVQDGIDYFFYVYDKSKGIICGEISSPAKSTRLFDLISICDQIMSYVMYEDADSCNFKDAISNFITKYE